MGMKRLFELSLGTFHSDGAIGDSDLDAARAQGPVFFRCGTWFNSLSICDRAGIGG